MLLRGQLSDDAVSECTTWLALYTFSTLMTADGMSRKKRKAKKRKRLTTTGTRRIVLYYIYSYGLVL